MRRPTVRLHVGQSVDGKLAAEGQKSAALGGRADRRAIARHRAWADAVLVGATTVRHADVPLHLADADLTARRLDRGRTAGPRAVVLCGSGVVLASARAFRRPSHILPQDFVRPLLAVGAGAEVAPELQAVAEIWQDPCRCANGEHTGPRAVCIPALLRHLAGQGVRRLLVEGGGQTAWGFVACRALDQICCTVAPLILGGSQAPTPVGGVGLAWTDRLQLQLTHARAQGDLLFLRYRVHRG